MESVDSLGLNFLNLSFYLANFFINSSEYWESNWTPRDLMSHYFIKYGILTAPIMTFTWSLIYYDDCWWSGWHCSNKKHTLSVTVLVLSFRFSFSKRWNLIISRLLSSPLAPHARLPKSFFFFVLVHDHGVSSWVDYEICYIQYIHISK